MCFLFGILAMSLRGAQEASTMRQRSICSGATMTKITSNKYLHLCKLLDVIKQWHSHLVRSDITRSTRRQARSDSAVFAQVRRCLKSLPRCLCNKHRKLCFLPKKKNLSVLFFWYLGNVISSRAVASQVFSAMRSLTSVFGMCTGAPSLYCHQDSFKILSLIL